MSPAPTFSYLTDVFFGNGLAASVGDICQQFQITRPLLVTDQGLVQLGMTERIGLAPAAEFADVETNPTESSVVRGVSVYRESKCDGIVALGGGSPIDCAKAISLLATHHEPLEQYAVIRGGLGLITADKPPLIAVPTTSGTGSEVGRAALITMKSGEKLGIISKYMIPTAAVCDPELTRDLPAQLTAATGMDAISHCVETFCSPKYNPVADAIALDGLRRAWQALPRAVDRQDDIEARGEMMLASTEGALAFQKGLGMIHSLSHPLGALAKPRLHHGTLNAVFLPHVIRYNSPECPDKIAAMAEVMGVPGDGPDVADAFARLNARIGLPGTLGEMGVALEHLGAIPAAAMRDHSTPTNPREMTEEDCRMVLEVALG